MGIFKRMFGPWSSWSGFQKLPVEDRTIVFYAESKADFPHLGPIAEELVGQGRRVTWVTSDEADPAFANPKLKTFWIGSDAARTVFFKSVDAKVLVMTLPDLETFHLKRSVHPVHYAYVFHSIVSTHMIYRKGAFDAYDTVLCVGPHHVDEIRRTEKAYGLRPKTLLEHGYARLDKILRTAFERPPFVPSAGPSKKILLAASWGECSFLEAPCGPELIELLLGAGHRVIARFHPMTVRHHPKLPGELEKRFGSAGEKFRVVTDMNEQESLQTSDLMISDWSGAAFDYAYGLERPVLFVDMPRKINNAEWETIGVPPLEASVREELGGVIDPKNLRAALPRIEAIAADPAGFRERLRASREKNVYNVGRSAAVGASHIATLADAPPQRQAKAQ